MPLSDTCRKRLTEEIEKSDEGARAKRARQRELEFYERAIVESDHQAKRKVPAASTTAFPSSSTRHRVGAGRRSASRLRSGRFSRSERGVTGGR